MALSWFRAADLQKLMVFCDFQIARATLCGLWAGRPSKTRGFLRFSNRPRDPLRTLGWSTFENSWFFAIFKSPARPSADFGLVDLRKLVVFCDFQIARATLCGLENSWFFAIFKSPARPSADFGLVDQPKVRRGSRGRFENRKKPRVFEGRPAQSPIKSLQPSPELSSGHSQPSTPCR